MDQTKLFGKLYDLDKAVKDRFPAPRNRANGLDILGLQIEEPEFYGLYCCTPVNCYVFAQTGGDGVHFNFLNLPGLPIKESPVVMTIPSSPKESQNTVVGATLHDFLCLGSRVGYYLLEDLKEDWPSPQDSLFQMLMREYMWMEDFDGFLEDAMRKQEVIDFFADQLDLNPWPNVRDRLRELKNEYFHLLQMPEEEETDEYDY